MRKNIYSSKISGITGRFKDLAMENTYCHFAMDNYRNRLVSTFIFIILFYLGMVFYDLKEIPTEKWSRLHLLFGIRLVTGLSALWCIYFLTRKNKARYMNGIMVFLVVSAIMPVYYNHMMEEIGQSFSFESSIFLFILYAITCGALFLIPFIYFLVTIIIQTFFFMFDSFEHHHLDFASHIGHIVIYLFVLAFVVFVSYNFNIIIRRGFYDRHVLVVQLKKSENKIHELNRIEGAFLAETTAQVISHEIKNSIATISTYIQMLMGVKKITETEQKVIQYIYDASVKSNEYVRQIRELSMGKLKLKKHNIENLLNEASYLWQTLQQEYNATINVNCIDYDIKTDASLLQGAIANIIRNGIEAKKDGIVNVNVFIKSDKLYIEIGNNKKLNIKNSKNMFSLLRSNAKKKTSTGIGLVFSRSVAEKLGGELKLTRKPDMTIFSFIFDLKYC